MKAPYFSLIFSKSINFLYFSELTTDFQIQFSNLPVAGHLVLFMLPSVDLSFCEVFQIEHSSKL